MTTTEAARGVPRTAGATRPPRRRRWRRTLIPWLFLVPGILFATVFKLLPMVDGIRMSAYKIQPFLGDLFVGLDNYVRVATDKRFLDALGHTLILGVATTLGAIVVGLGLALLLEGSSRIMSLARTGVFLPVVTAVAVIGEIWRVLYFPTESGFINTVIGFFGIPPQEFLSSPDTALLYVAVVGIWTAAPYNMVIILAGLAGIDRTLYEAAAVDGATTLQRLRHIVLPGLRASLAVILTLAAIRSLRTFTEVFVLTGGGPAGSTEVWMTRTYSLGFKANEPGLASAASVMLLIATLILTITVRGISSRKAQS